MVSSNFDLKLNYSFLQDIGNNLIIVIFLKIEEILTVGGRISNIDKFAK